MPGATVEFDQSGATPLEALNGVVALHADVHDGLTPQADLANLAQHHLIREAAQMIARVNPGLERRARGPGQYEEQRHGE